MYDSKHDVQSTRFLVEIVDTEYKQRNVMLLIKYATATIVDLAFSDM